MNFPKELTAVSPVSKILAAILFITFPFIGFFLGIRYQEMTNLAESQGIEENPTITRVLIPTPTAIPTIDPSITAGWQTYRSDEFGFEVKYPENFHLTFTPLADTRSELENNKFGAIVVEIKEQKWIFESASPALFIDVIKSDISFQEWLAETQQLPEIDIKDIQNIIIDGFPALQYDQFFSKGHQIGTVFQRDSETLYDIVGYSNELGEFPVKTYHEILSTFRFVEKKKTYEKVPSGYNESSIEVKFKSGIEIADSLAILPQDLRNNVESMKHLFSRPESQQDPVLGRWFSVKLKPETDSIQFINALILLEEVEIAEFAPLPAPPP